MLKLFSNCQLLLFNEARVKLRCIALIMLSLNSIHDPLITPRKFIQTFLTSSCQTSFREEPNSSNLSREHLYRVVTLLLQEIFLAN